LQKKNDLHERWVLTSPESNIHEPGFFLFSKEAKKLANLLRVIERGRGKGYLEMRNRGNLCSHNDKPRYREVDF